MYIYVYICIYIYRYKYIYIYIYIYIYARRLRVLKENRSHTQTHDKNNNDRHNPRRYHMHQAAITGLITLFRATNRLKRTRRFLFPFGSRTSCIVDAPRPT